VWWGVIEEWGKHELFLDKPTGCFFNSQNIKNTNNLGGGGGGGEYQKDEEEMRQYGEDRLINRGVAERGDRERGRFQSTVLLARKGTTTHETGVSRTSGSN